MHKEVTAQKNVFVAGSGPLANDINAKANELYQQLLSIDAASLETGNEYKDYFANHHLGRRLFFSLQNSAHIIYYSVKKTGKPVSDLTFIDYGAGLGTLFVLAGKMGFKKNIYNDYLPEWHQPAKTLCNAVQAKIDSYVPGDIDDVIKHAAENKIQYDIIASRNVIEHIYSLPHFYKSIYKHNAKAIVYSTTTANYHNPAMRFYHRQLHSMGEKNGYWEQRVNEIKKLSPGASKEQLEKLASLTRGKGQKDFADAVNDFFAGKEIAIDKTLRTNTCDCITGVWNEHLLTKKEHEEIITAAGFKMEYAPGYWDTHYKSTAMNIAAKIFNKIILLLGSRGIILSPFVNITAYN